MPFQDIHDLVVDELSQLNLVLRCLDSSLGKLRFYFFKYFIYLAHNFTEL